MNYFTAGIVARFTTVGLFLWFGIAQLLEPELWLGFLPEWTGYLPIPGEVLVSLNGWTEIILALMLALGFHTRVVQIILGVHLFAIGLTAQGATATRDIALALFILATSIDKPDALTFDARVTR